jgi:hypothetical protein
VGLVAILAYDFEGPMLHVLLNCRIIHLATNQPLSIEDGVVGVHCGLILCCISNQAL